jgi:hypothetical protein
VDDLAEQTVNTLFLEEGHFQLRWLVNTSIYHFLPLLFWLSGWASVILGITGVPKLRFPK